MKIYNTLTKKKEEFYPLNPPKVTMYVCGPTVYDFFHIGNARSFLLSDMIRRYLIYKGYDLKFVMNLTDIDDKIIRKAQEENISFSDVAKKYSEAFFEDIEKLKIKKADANPKATEHIAEIISLIQILIEKGYAYVSEGDVYYDVSKFAEYGKLSGKKIDELEAGARVEVSEHKKNPLDFALWKKAKENEPFWDSPWGKGRPGWHIECSAMSQKHLGETIDIHAGGSDLIFPHHENEIAQSEAACGKQFVRYWIHFGFLNILTGDKFEKMSKSLGNFFTAREILKKYSAGAIRLFMFQTKYSAPLNFSEDALIASQKGLEKVLNFSENLDVLEKKAKNSNEISFDIKKYFLDFDSAMDDDFNSPQAIAAIFDFIRDFNSFVAQKEPTLLDVKNAKAFLQKTAVDVFAFLADNNKTSSFVSIEDDLINILIDVRQKLKNQKNYELADFIRNSLNKIGIVLQDGKEGTTFKKERKYE